MVGFWESEFGSSLWHRDRNDTQSRVFVMSRAWIIAAVAKDRVWSRRDTTGRIAPIVTVSAIEFLTALF